MENTLNGDKISITVHFCISRLIIKQHEKNFISSFSLLAKVDKAGKPSHDTVPLKWVYLRTSNSQQQSLISQRNMHYILRQGSFWMNISMSSILYYVYNKSGWLIWYIDLPREWCRWVGGRLEVFVYLTEVIFPHANRFPGHLAIWTEARPPPSPRHNQPPLTRPGMWFLQQQNSPMATSLTFCDIRFRYEVTVKVYGFQEVAF